MPCTQPLYSMYCTYWPIGKQGGQIHIIQMQLKKMHKMFPVLRKTHFHFALARITSDIWLPLLRNLVKVETITKTRIPDWAWDLVSPIWQVRVASIYTYCDFRKNVGSSSNYFRITLDSSLHSRKHFFLDYLRKHLHVPSIGSTFDVWFGALQAQYFEN